jgi:hypothetical protein
MQRLRKFWRDAGFWHSRAGRRLTEYILIGLYSSVAILSLVIGLTAKAGTLFGRATESANYGARPDLKSILKQLMLASADFSAGVSLLIIAVVIVYWTRGAKGAQRQSMETTVPPGPPFLL